MISHSLSGFEARAENLPEIRRIGPTDLKDALQAGVGDFLAMPTHLVFLALIYPIVGFILARVTMNQGLLPLVYPLVAGFALVGPFAAIGLYEISRRRERGLDITWRNAFDVLHAPSRGSIVALGILLMVVFAVWIAVAHAIYVALMGAVMPTSMADLLRQVVSTQAGLALFAVGNLAGLLFAIVSLTIGVVSFPMLLDRDVGASTALLTSVRAVMKNPATMALWGVIVGAALLIGSVPFLVGLAVVMPILGHATWHLYRRTVEPSR